MPDIGISCQKRSYGRGVGKPWNSVIAAFKMLNSFFLDRYHDWIQRLESIGYLAIIKLSVFGAWFYESNRAGMGKYFPEVNSGSGGGIGGHLTQFMYGNQPAPAIGRRLSEYTQLMLAFTAQGYKWGDTHRMPVPDSGDVLRSRSPDSDLYCTASNQYYPINYTEAWTVQYHSNDMMSQGTKAALYTQQMLDEQLLILNVRGSETVDLGAMVRGLQKEKYMVDINSINDVVQDWMGTDLFVMPAEDSTCNKPGVKMHTGWQLAWKRVRDKVIEAANRLLGRLRNERPNIPIKFFITGHSLGGGVSAVASYDLWCNQWLDNQIIPASKYTEQVFTITFGQPIVFYQYASVTAYQSTVPVTNRLRASACGHLSSTSVLNNPLDFYSCDIVTVTVGVLGAGESYVQPHDGDFQALWVNKVQLGQGSTWNHEAIAGDCYGGLSHEAWGDVSGANLLDFLSPGWCHLLDRHLQGCNHDSSTLNGGICM
jgi:hypothetical protein